MTTYLDWNATTPPHEAVLAALSEGHSEAWANPQSVHAAGRAARERVETCREAVGALLHLNPRDVLFTSGGTEANHLAMNGATMLIVSEIEHPSVMNQAEELGRTGALVEHAKANPHGRVEADAVEAALERLYQRAGRAPQPFRGQSGGGLTNADTPLVCVLAAHHETGILQPIREISEVVRKFGARLHVDAVQLFGRGDLQCLHFADSVTVCSHKIRGPKGVGVLGFGAGFQPLPLTRGGAQERGLRPGTVDGAALSGFLAALERLDDSVRGYESAGRLGARLADLLTEAPSVTLHAATERRLTHVVNFRAKGWRGDELVAALDLMGLCISSGSACSAGTAEPSPSITAMLGAEAAAGAVRVSFGEGSQPEDLNALVSALVSLGVLSPGANAGVPGNLK